MADTSIIECVRVDPASPVPLYAQLSANLRTVIAQGRAAPATCLPTVQTLARHCGMSQATVMRALSDLASEGLIVTRRGARSVVAERRAASTEVLFQTQSTEPTEREISFFSQLLDGLREGYADASRRFLTTFMAATPASGDELVRVCQVGGADGLVAYRPDAALAPLLREASEQVPTVTLFHPAGDARADCVAVDPAPAMRRLLRERLLRGQKHFFYIGASALFRTQPVGFSPHRTIYETFFQVIREAGLSATECLVEKTKEEARRQAEAASAGMPDGATVVAAHPRLAMECEGPQPRLDLIAYTEYRQSLDQARGRVTALYLGLESVGRAAAELLRSRVQSRNTLAPRAVRLAPEVVPAYADEKRRA